MTNITISKSLMFSFIKLIIAFIRWKTIQRVSPDDERYLQIVINRLFEVETKIEWEEEVV